MKMNKLQNILAIALLAVSFTSCIDDGAKDLIDLTAFTPAEDTTYIDIDTFNKATRQERKILIQDFTGVKCSNCPKAASTIKKIKENNPDRVVSVAIHSGPENFTHPKTDHSKYDFRTSDGDRIASMLGGVVNMPIGTVDQVLFEGEEDILTSFISWEGQSEKRLKRYLSPLNLDINVERFDKDTIIFLVRVLYDSLQNDGVNFLNVYLTEDGIVDYQYDLILGDIEEYDHEHVFRDNLTALGGDSLVVKGEANPYVEGRVFQKRFVVAVKNDDPTAEYSTGWNYQNLNAVAFVSRKRAKDFEVIHAVEKHLGE